MMTFSSAALRIYIQKETQNVFTQPILLKNHKLFKMASTADMCAPQRGLLSCLIIKYHEGQTATLLRTNSIQCSKVSLIATEFFL